MGLVCIAVPLLAGLFIAFVLPVSATSLVLRTDRLIERLQQLGVEIDRLDRAGPRRRARCLQHGSEPVVSSQGLRAEPSLQLDVLAHEAIHVVQDCLDGFETLLIHHQLDVAVVEASVGSRSTSSLPIIWIPQQRSMCWM